MVATKSPPRLTELEAAEREVEQAAQRAEVARQRAEAAAEAARQRQAERQRQWADLEIGGHAERIKHHAEAIGRARLAFEQAVLSDLPAASTAFLTWVGALAQRHACEASFDMARGIIGQPAARLSEWPDPGFTDEVDAVLQARSYELLEESTAAEQAMRRRAFDGMERGPSDD